MLFMSQVHCLAQLWVIVSGLCTGETTGCVSACKTREKRTKGTGENGDFFS